MTQVDIDEHLRQGIIIAPIRSVPFRESRIVGKFRAI